MNRQRTQQVAAVYRVHPDTPPTPNIRVYTRNQPDRFHTLNYTNENVQPLTFPLLFPRGDTGWHPYIPHAINARSRITLCEYYAYRLAVRDREQGFRYARKLTQQYIVNAYVDIESNRLGYIRENQDRIRADQYVGLADYLHRRNLNNDGEERLALGRMIILPSSYIGSPRSQHQNFQDAMAVACKYGNPSLFVTMTTNPNWSEIIDNIPEGQRTADHPLLTARVLGVHLPERQVFTFRPGFEIQALQRNETTQLTAWFALNQAQPAARQYLYTEIPQHYVWQQAQRRWTNRQRGGDKVITRMYSVNFRNMELYCLRTLLLHVRGAQSYEDLRTVDGDVCATFLEACQRRNLMADDAEWRRALREACQRDMPRELRGMFSYLLICDVSDRLALWTEFRPQLIEDFTRNGLDEDEATQRALAHIQSVLTVNGTRLSNFGLPEPRAVAHLADEPIDVRAEREEGERLRNQLNAEQSALFEGVMNAVQHDDAPHRLFFVNAAAGAGKSFVFQTLITSLRGENVTVLALAPTGIAASLLKGGRTIHSRFKLPLDINETTTAGVTPRSSDGRLIRESKLIIIDEISMVTRTVLIILERALRDICADNRPFGNKVVLVGGDFRQTLPVIVGAHRADIVDECVRTSLARFRFACYNLIQNVRAEHDQQQFCNWLLDLGNGILPPYRRTFYGDLIQIPPQCIVDTKEELLDFCLGNLDFDFISNKAVLTPLNITCNELNSHVIERLPGQAKTYMSADSIDITDQPDLEVANYSVEFLNSLNPSGFPPHRLYLKVGAIVVLLRNLDLRQNLCNGTRLLIRVLGSNYIDAERIDPTGRLTGHRVFIPRIDLINGNSTLPFKRRRRQFPVKLAYAMTINKSQGQTFDRVGIVLPSPVFAHGQLYVAFSRAKAFDKVKIFIEQTPTQGNINEAHQDNVYTRNIVYREVL
ncbi:hypothetical protein NQ318_009144 [Aromia moschata]|uniref:ATP-dependent DNA helicase n=1 Tax=Aromia moschata TaxID=1265417 RepID=A0AAV8XGL6_9CUCU|nr:hypothetical protein NQ318_009144 [Aromia moschata]